MSIFDSSITNKPKKSKFNLTHQVVGSTEIGRLTPFLCRELVPGDRFHVTTSSFTRTMPLVAPMFHECDTAIHYFFVPKRLLWSEWEDHITGGIDGTSVPEYPKLPLYMIYGLYLSIYGITDSDAIAPNQLTSTLFDYLGIPIPQTVDELRKFMDYQETLALSSRSEDLEKVVYVSLLPFLAMRKIYEDWYVNLNLQDTELVKKPLSTEDIIAMFVPRPDYQTFPYPIKNYYVNFEKDYFTSALLEPQRGSDVFVPISINPEDLRISQSSDMGVYFESQDGTITPSAEPVKVGPNISNDFFGMYVYPEDAGRKQLRYPPNFFEDNLSINGQIQSGGMNIEDLRASARLQEWLELNARGGSRYIEQIYAHFGVISSDARLQRSQFLGGGRSPLQISEVLQTSETQETPLGDMAGRAISLNSDNSVSVFAEEHGYLFGLYFVKPRILYKNQGLDRMWTRFDKFDEYFPKFANLGEQDVYNYELNVFPSPLQESAQDTDVMETFGYQERFADFKFIKSRTCGEMSHSLDFWTMARSFSGTPILSDEFINTKYADFDNVFAVEAQSAGDRIIFHNRVGITAYRPMPYHALPTL